MVDKKVFNDLLEAKWDQLIAVRNEVTKPLEAMRKEKVIGKSLDAQIHLYAEGDTYALLNEMKDELASIFIVSKVMVSGIEAVPSDAYQSEDIKDLAVKVSPATGQSCERCWIYTDDIGTDEQYPTLCRRCAEVMKQQ